MTRKKAETKALATEWHGKTRKKTEAETRKKAEAEALDTEWHGIQSRKRERRLAKHKN